MFFTTFDELNSLENSKNENTIQEENFFADNLKYLRKKENLTQYELAKLLDLDRSTISQYENKRFLPGKNTTKKILNLYKIPKNDLFYKNLASHNYIYSTESNHSNDQNIKKILNNDSSYKYNNFKLKYSYFKNWRHIKNLEMEFGSNINVISGHNGTGKSNILALLASASGYRANNSKYPIVMGVNATNKFHPLFTEYFVINESEYKEKNYSVFHTFTTKKDDKEYYFSKFLRLKDDRKYDRGIRIIPDNTDTPKCISEKIKKDKAHILKKDDISNNLQVGMAQRVPIPTLYLSLSRLHPLGESDIDESENLRDSLNKNFDDTFLQKFSSWYNKVIPDSVSNNPNFYKVSKSTTNLDYAYIDLKNTTLKTQSIGQDSLSSIITAIHSFYELSINNDINYNGGILCIDEVDTSLHPDAQRHLIDLLKNLSIELNLQVFITTHSMTVIKEISTLQEMKPDKYKLIYLKNKNAPQKLEHIDYNIIKADMFEDINYAEPKIKVFFEDEVGLNLFSLIVDTIILLDPKHIKNSYKINNLNSKLELIATGIGYKTAQSLVQADEYFKNVLFILDGDAIADRHMKSSIDYSKYFQNNKFFNFFTYTFYTKPNIDAIKHLISKEHIENMLSLPNFKTTRTIFNKLKKYNEKNKNINNKEIEELIKFSNDYSSHGYNILYLPGLVPPEVYMFNIIYELCVNSDIHIIFWRNLDEKAIIYTPRKIQNKLKDTFNIDICDNNFSNITIEKLKTKNLSDFMIKFLSETNAIYYYYTNDVIDTNINELICFANNLINRMEYINKKSN